MWRIDAVRYYQYLLFLLIITEIIVILAVVILMVGFSFNITLPFALADFLSLAVLITSLILLNLFAYTILYQFTSNRRDEGYRGEYHHWMKIWAQTYFMKEPLEPVPIKQAVVDAHLAFTKSLPDQTEMLELAIQHKIRSFWRNELTSRNKIKVLHAIEALGVLGDEGDFESLMNFIGTKDLDLAINAIISLAYIIQRLPDDMLNESLEQYCLALLQVQIPVFVVEDVYSILDGHYEYLNRYFLSQDVLPDNFLLAIIRVIGTQYNTHFAENIQAYLSHENPMIQGAVLNTYRQLNYIPRDAYSDVLRALSSENQLVREQALKTLKNKPLFQTRLPLWLSLGDQNWQVRFEAAKMLKSYGEEGETVLRSASKKHISTDGREIALKVLHVDM